MSILDKLREKNQSVKEEKVTLKRFVMTPELYNLSHSIMSLRERAGMKYGISKPLSFFYDLVEKNNFRKKYLELIRSNLI